MLNVDVTDLCVLLWSCNRAGAKNHGLAIYGDLFGSPCTALVEDCLIADNKGIERNDDASLAHLNRSPQGSDALTGPTSSCEILHGLVSL